MRRCGAKVANRAQVRSKSDISHDESVIRRPDFSSTFGMDAGHFVIVLTPPVAVIEWRAVRPTIELSLVGFDQLIAHPRFRPQYGVVSDWRGATADAAPHFDRDFLIALGKLQSEGALAGRWATVVPDSVQRVDLYRAGRTIEILGRMHGLRYDVFTNYEDALAWVSDPGQRKSRKRRVKVGSDAPHQ